MDGMIAFIGMVAFATVIGLVFNLDVWISNTRKMGAVGGGIGSALFLGVCWAIVLFSVGFILWITGIGVK